MLAPGVDRPDGIEQPFATLPYILSHDLLTARKPVLEKALAVVACLQCGEHFGGYSDLPADALVAVIDTQVVDQCETCLHRTQAAPA